MDSTDAWSWPLVISGVGVLIWLGFVWNFLVELRTITAVWPPLLAFLIGTGLSASLIYAGYRFNREDWIDAQVAARIIVWGVGGLLLVSLLRILTIAIRLAEGRPLAEPQLDVLISIAGGMIAGVIAGFLHERAKNDAENARKTQEAATFLNRTIRHEVLNGLSIIKGNVEIARDRLQDDELRSKMDTIQSRADDITDMVQNIRIFMNTFTGRNLAEPINLSEVLKRRITAIRETYPEVVVTSDIPPNIYVLANDGLTFVFKNILENAVEHNDKATPEIALDVDVTADRVTVTVADNGPGIPADRRENVLEPELDRKHRFGLYLVHTLVTDYGGDLAITDNDPEGTVVSVELPRTEPDQLSL